MKTVGVRVSSKAKLKKMIEIDDSLKSMDDAVNRLLDLSECESIDNSRVNIHMKDATLERLKSYKAYPTEPNNLILARLLDQLEI